MKRKVGHAKSVREKKFGKSFEDSLFPILQSILPDTQKQIKIVGSSGNIYKADFVANKKTLLIEASATYKVQQKVASTICKFVDIERKYPGMQFVMVLKCLPQEQNQNRNIYRQAKAFGYTLLHPTQIEQLKLKVI